MGLRRLGLAGLLLLVPTGHASDGSATNATAEAPFRIHGEAARGRPIYESLCTPCHGVRGDGKGPLAQKLDAPTPDFTDAEAMLAKEDAALYEVVREGGACHGKSGLMQAWERHLSEQEIHDVLSYIRTLAMPLALQPGEAAL